MGAPHVPNRRPQGSPLLYIPGRRCVRRMVGATLVVNTVQIRRVPTQRVRISPTLKCGFERVCICFSVATALLFRSISADVLLI